MDRASRPRILFTCGREPDYVRNRLLVRALSSRYEVTVVASSARGYARRFSSVAARLVQAARHSDVIVTGFLGQPLAILAAQLGKPVVLDAFVSIFDTLCLDRKTASPRGSVGTMTYWIDRIAFRSADTVLVDTASQAHFFADTFHLAKQRFHVHYLGPDFELLGRSSASMDRSTGAVEALHYGSYLPLHGVEIILEAARLLRYESNLRFTLIGRGPRYAPVCRAARQMDLTNVDFVDWLPKAVLGERISRATIGLGGHFADNPKARRVIAGKTFQLLASGVSTIVGDGAANHELFGHGENTIFVPMGDPWSLAEATRGLAADVETRVRLARAGRDLIRERFEPERVVNSLGSAIDSAIERHALGRPKRQN